MLTNIDISSIELSIECPIRAPSPSLAFSLNPGKFVTTSKIEPNIVSGNESIKASLKLSK